MSFHLSVKQPNNGSPVVEIHAINDTFQDMDEFNLGHIKEFFVTVSIKNDSIQVDVTPDGVIKPELAAYNSFTAPFTNNELAFSPIKSLLDVDLSVVDESDFVLRRDLVRENIVFLGISDHFGRIIDLLHIAYSEEAIYIRKPGEDDHSLYLSYMSIVGNEQLELSTDGCNLQVMNTGICKFLHESNRDHRIMKAIVQFDDVSESGVIELEIIAGHYHNIKMFSNAQYMTNFSGNLSTIAKAISGIAYFESEKTTPDQVTSMLDSISGLVVINSIIMPEAIRNTGRWFAPLNMLIDYIEDRGFNVGVIAANTANGGFDGINLDITGFTHTNSDEQVLIAPMNDSVVVTAANRFMAFSEGMESEPKSITEYMTKSLWAIAEADKAE